MLKARLAACVVLLILVSACVPADGPDIRLATWNIQHLAVRAGDGCHPRTEADYAELRQYAEALDADVIAFQEVESAAAIARVLDPGRYRIVVESRPPVARRICNRHHPELVRTPLAVGFAVRRDLTLRRNPDISALGLGDPERSWGVDITVRKGGGRPFRLMAVHLKPGCSDGVSRSACPDLYDQQAVLTQWIRARVAAGERFAIMGDFNRVLRSSHDAFFMGLTAGGRLPLSVATRGRPSHCQPRKHPFVEQIVLGGGARRNWRDYTELRYRPGYHPLSDHCAVRIRVLDPDAGLWRAARP